MKQKKILLAENDRDFASELAKSLEAEGHKVIRETIWDSICSQIMADSPPIMVILNTSLPGINIFNEIKELRPFFNGLLVLLSDQDNDFDQILALELGADDFIVKPVHLRVIMARIHGLLRRPNFIKKTGENKSVSVGDLTVDAARREAYLNGKRLDLTTIQFDLLWYLISNAGNVVSRDDLYNAVRERDYNGIDRSIDIYISRIRQKLGDDPSNPCFLKTVRGTGYLFAGEKS